MEVNMERKKLIVRIGLIAVFVVLLGISGNIVEYFYTARIDKKLAETRQAEMAKMNETFQKYLDETAAKIQTLEVNQHLLSQINSYILKRNPDVKLYLWMSDSQGEFVFGSPSPVFARVNKAYDKYKNHIKQAGYYLDRNDFLSDLVDKSDEVDFSKYDFRGRWHSYYRTAFFVLSSPVLNENKEVIGDLYVKVNAKNAQAFSSRAGPLRYKDFFEIFRVFMALGFVCLWLLIPSWVYIDARQRDLKNAFMWAMLTVISVGFALIIYLIVRPQTLKSFQCPKCESKLSGPKSFCPYCGQDLSTTFCSQCQSPVESGWQFCPNCRFDLRQKSDKEVKELETKEAPKK
jgi:hypothetical protein